ncbi:M1 family metallopeptidase [Mariniblastus sp.]|nr:M1 family metallopeptidase [Mariniblastus sp.]
MILNKWAPLRILVSAVSVLCVMVSLEAQELPHSCARPDQIAIAHLHLDLKVDFESQKLAGLATMKLDRRTAASKLYLDTNGLKIFKVQSQPDGKELKWSLGEHEPNLGSSLSVELVDGVDEVTVYYESQPGAEAVQWLTPEQTTDKKYPFLFTQSQAILARTWVPCQDTPAVRMTYSAKIQVPPELLAVMSASNPQRKNKTGVYEFEMKQPIPAYLLALAVGDLKFLELGPRSGVYAEPSVLKKAVWELADTEKMISAAEALYGEYRWDRYDVIFLPSSFPFGGMENPRLTFATPTILAGDRSLVALIAHELAHSWSGNLVTNATWDDFWLNEGFTVYFEQRIMEAIYGREYSEMLAKLSLDGLLAEIKELEARDTWLKLDLRGRNPDDGMTSIAYDKGYFFLRMLEEKVGREKFDQFLKSYFKKFAFKSMTTEGFLSYLQENLDKKIDFNAWVYSPGLPADVPVVKTEALERVEQAAQNFLNGGELSVLAVDFETDQWTTHHWNHFLRSFKNDLSPAQMKSLDDQFRFTQSGNSEITHDWMVLVIGSGYQTGFPRLEEFLTEQGRRKFLQPLYEKMATTPEGLERANRIYAKARPGYHAVSRQTIDKILNYTPTEN